MKDIILLLLRWYSYRAKTFPLPTCRFSPTCSAYAYQAIGKYGILKGSWLTSKRLLRCHPWSLGGPEPPV